MSKISSTGSPDFSPNTMKFSITQPRVLAFYKPFDVLTQFTDETGRATLKNYIDVPGVYAAGRLDRDSEGLLLLTNVGALAHRLTDPKFEHEKTYLVQVEQVPDQKAIDALTQGVDLKDGRTRPADVELIGDPPNLPDRPVPIRFRKNVPTSWLKLTIREGKNRQVRRMTASVGHPTLRLVRIAIGAIGLGALQPGQWRELNVEEVGCCRATTRRNPIVETRGYDDDRGD